MIKVSIRLMCYNQEKYIAQAIDSILMQRVDFDYEIVVGDDYSTDSTLKIINKYQENYPQLFKILERNHRVGRLRNFAETVENCRGKYIALLDGDDYWVDPNKLQQQVEFLDKNPECVICFTDCLICDEHGSPVSMHVLGEQVREDIDQRDLCSGKYFRVPTVMFRNIVRIFPKEFYEVFNADIFLFCLLLNYGKAGYINEITAHYRLHGGGIWSFKDRAFMIENNLKTYITLLSIIDDKSRPHLLANIKIRYKKLIDCYKINNNYISLLKTICRFSIHRLKYIDFKLTRINSLIKTVI